MIVYGKKQTDLAFKTRSVFLNENYSAASWLLGNTHAVVLFNLATVNKYVDNPPTTAQVTPFRIIAPVKLIGVRPIPETKPTKNAGTIAVKTIVTTDNRTHLFFGRTLPIL